MKKIVIGVTHLGTTPLRRYLQNKYTDSLHRCGVKVVELAWPNDAVQAAALLKGCDGLLLPGGVDLAPALYGEETHACCDETNPTRDAAEKLLYEEARRLKMPILGICRGCQLLNALGGGTLYQDIATEAEGTHLQHSDYLRRGQYAHRVQLAAGSRLAALCGVDEIAVNSMHHQAVRDLAPCFVATAVSEDGLVEGIEDPTPSTFCVAVQWHPEHLFRRDKASQGIFRGFINAAAQWRNAQATTK